MLDAPIGTKNASALAVHVGLPWNYGASYAMATLRVDLHKVVEITYYQLLYVIYMNYNLRYYTQGISAQANVGTTNPRAAASICNRFVRN